MRKPDRDVGVRVSYNAKNARPEMITLFFDWHRVKKA